MKVIELANFQRPRGGSFIPMLSGVLAEVRRRGWEAEAVFFEGARESDWIGGLEEEGVTVRLAPVEAERSRAARRRWLAREIADETGPVVLHTHFTAWDLAALFSARSRRGDAVFWHVHTVLSRSPIVVARGAFKFGVLGRRTAGIFAPAPNIADGIRRLGAPDDRVEFVPSVLEMSRFPLLSEDDRVAARSELGVPVGATVLLQFGWHFHLKGNDIFLETMKVLLDEHPDLDLIGECRGGGEETLAAARRLGIEDHVRILEPVESATTLFGAADVVVSSSREEGMAYAVLESLATGTPVVATNIPGHAFIGDNVAACRIVERDPRALAAGILETLGREPEEAAREAADARRWLVDNLAVDRVATWFADAYEAAVQERT